MILSSFLTLLAVAALFGIMAALSNTDTGLVMLYPMALILLISGVGTLNTGLEVPTGKNLTHTEFNNTIVQDTEETTYSPLLSEEIAGYSLSEILGFTLIVISIFGFVVPTRFELRTALGG